MLGSHRVLSCWGLTGFDRVASGYFRPLRVYRAYLVNSWIVKNACSYSRWSSVYIHLGGNIGECCLGCYYGDADHLTVSET